MYTHHIFLLSRFVTPLTILLCCMPLLSSGPKKGDDSDVIHQETSQRRPAWPHRSLVQKTKG